MITMEDIIREGHPTLREVAVDVPLPITDEIRELGAEMLTFLKNSQDDELAEKYQLRGGVGLAAPQLNISKRVIALEIPGETEDAPPVLSTVMINPKIISHSVQDACLAEGEGCLSVDRDVPGYVVRHMRTTVSYFDLAGEQHKIKVKGYPAMVIQHEIDHLNGIMFYDHINEDHPYAISDDVFILE